jgi:hypothetical protein
MVINLEDWEKLPKQDELFADVSTETLLYSAGLGSGKTHYLCRKALKLSALNRGHPGGFLVPAYTDFSRDVKPEMEKILEEMLGLQKNKHWWFHETKKEYSFAWNKKPLYIFTGEKPIAGPNLAYCLINEFSLIPYVRIQEMLRRVRVKEAPYRQKNLAGTPEDVHGWLEEFISKYENDPTFKIVYSDTAENTFINDDYRAHLEKMLDSQSLKVFASGQIVKIGSDYFYFSFDRTKNIQPVKYDPDRIVYVGMDFNVGKMASSFSHKIEDKQLFFDEILLEGNSDTDQMCKAILQRYPKEKIKIRCDASGNARKTSGSSDVNILHSYFGKENVLFTTVNPRLRDRQLLINGMLDHGRVLIDPSCKLIIKDFEKVKQNKTDFTKDKDKDDKLTHFSDGADYVLWIEHLNNIVLKARTVDR